MAGPRPQWVSRCADYFVNGVMFTKLIVDRPFETQDPAGAVALIVMVNVKPGNWPLVILPCTLMCAPFVEMALSVVSVVAAVDDLPLLQMIVSDPDVLEPGLAPTSVLQLPRYLLFDAVIALVTPPPTQPPILPAVTTVAFTLLDEVSFGNAGLYTSVPLKVLQTGVAAADPAGGAAHMATGINSDMANRSPANLRM